MVIPPPVSFEKHRIAAGIVKDILPKLISQVADNLEINCIDCFTALENLKERQGLKEDGIHLSPVGAREVASAILPHVLNSLSRANAQAKPGLSAPAHNDGDDASSDTSSLTLEDTISVPCHISQ